MINEIDSFRNFEKRHTLQMIDLGLNADFEKRKEL